MKKSLCTYRRCRWGCDKVLSLFPVSRLSSRSRPNSLHEKHFAKDPPRRLPMNLRPPRVPIFVRPGSATRSRIRPRLIKFFMVLIISFQENLVVFKKYESKCWLSKLLKLINASNYTCFFFFHFFSWSISGVIYRKGGFFRSLTSAVRQPVSLKFEESRVTVSGTYDWSY